MSPAIALLGITQCLLAFLIPLLLGLLTYRSGGNARFWFASGVIYAFYILLLMLSPSKDFSFIRLLQMAILWLYIAGLLFVLLREFKPQLSPVLITALAAPPIFAQAFLSLAGARGEEQIIQSLFVVGGDSALGLLGLLLARRGHGRGFWLVSASGFLVAAINLLRAEELLFGSGSFATSDFTWKTNLLVVGHLIGLIFVNIGYAGVVIERAATKEAAAREGQRVAEESARRIKVLLDERDQMVMINSQFATMSGMSVLTGAIIHEITQPIQALVIAVDKARSEADGNPRLSDSLREVEEQAADCISLVQALRVIMSRGYADTELADLASITRDVIPIIASECGRRGITFDTEIEGAALTCRINPVLFKRIIINLAANAIEALADKPTGDRHLSVRLRRDGVHAMLEVEDDAGQDADIEALTFESLAGSKKPTGMGLGLMLCAKIASSWQGQFRAMQPAGTSGRSVFLLQLPLTEG